MEPETAHQIQEQETTQKMEGNSTPSNSKKI